MFLLNDSKIKEKLISINRVSKTVKGGRIFSFTALVVTGNGKGSVGFGYGKSKDISVAIKKAVNKSIKNTINFNIYNETILHRVSGKYNKSIIIINPSKIGTGIISGKVPRAIFEVSGINNISAKIYGSKNAMNVVYATILALKNLKTIKNISKKRNIKIKKIFY